MLMAGCPFVLLSVTAFLQLGPAVPQRAAVIIAMRKFDQDAMLVISDSP
jgi:hypothetical protein